MEYYMLECYAPIEQWDFLAVDGPPPKIKGVTSWFAGQSFGVSIPEPIELRWDPTTSGDRKYVYDAVVPLYHVDVCAALRRAGVNNLDMYPAKIVNMRNGEVCEDYLAVNVVGLVAAADLRRSIYRVHGGHALIDVDFDSLAVDGAVSRGLLMFRLAECVTGVVIHRRVKESLEAEGGFGLTFVEPKDWIG